MNIKYQAFMAELEEKIRGGYLPTRKDRERMHRAVTESLRALGARLIRTTWLAALLAGLAIGKSIFDVVRALLER